ncbi:kelch-like protein 10 [Ictalurus punctatus]|uniref:Kelch-like protein 10 n=1 Tax=Ictalurus punctatus TaxID=7998 RepID=A0A9F7RGC1_ICTPU|nr:kelch-like protein 10 [Ictalurus punctatus]XP_053534683.1 kelch-like protein 10 [Ictalurus punctatus]
MKVVHSVALTCIKTGQKISKQEEEKGMQRKVDGMSCNIINELRLEKKLCDVVIMVDGAEFHVHKNILCSCSPYFMVLFTKGWYPPDKLRYSIPNVSTEIMELVVEYAYIRRVNITEKNVCKLLIAADYLLVSSLVNECCAFLKAQLCPENCINLWRFAHSYFCEKLKQQAFRFILHNFEEMVRLSVDFLDLTVVQLSEIIEKDELNVKQESVVFEAVLQWIKHAPWKRKAHIGVLLPKVRLGLLTHDYLMNNVSNNVLVMDDMTCKPIVTSILMGIDDLNPSLSLSSDLTRLRLPSAVLLAIGGWYQRNRTNAIKAHDTRAARWVCVTCSDESPPSAHHGTVYLNGFVYCIGGIDSEDFLCSVRRFDPITRIWAQVHSMHYCRCDVSVCVLDSRIYAMGGFNGFEHLNTVERYEPENDRWCMIAPMHGRRSSSSATVLNGKVYICGGYDIFGCLFTGEYYSPQTRVWTLITPMMIRRCGLGVVAYGGWVYAVGGNDGVNHLSDVEVYNPQTNVWTPGPAMNNQRSHFSIEVLDDLLFVVGGENSTTIIDEVECYDEQTSEWHAIENMGISCHALSCCVLSGLPNMAEYAAPRDDPYRVPQSSRSTRGYLTPPANV